VVVWILSLLSASGAFTFAGTELEAIHRANGDGSNMEQVVSSDVARANHRIAVGAGFVFWPSGPVTFLGNPSHSLRRATLDGGDVHDVLAPTSVNAVATDSINGKVYFSPGSDCCCDSIARVNLDGSGFEFLFPACFPGPIAVHPPMGLVCWGDIDGIVCGKLDTGDTELVVGAVDAVAVALDATNDKLYWARRDGIFRANLDGSSVETLATGLDSVRDIALDPGGGHMWWTEQGSGKIRRADLDGSNVQDVVLGLDAPTGIDFAGSNGKIYWLSLAPPLEVPAASPSGLLLLGLLLLGASSTLVVRQRGRAAAR